jgi:RHS repeat-associated protein
VALPSGRVVAILSITGGMAVLDVDGSGQPASAAALAALGITDAERRTLATLYQPGQTLWRTLVPHFSGEDVSPATGVPADAVGVIQEIYGSPNGQLGGGGPFNSNADPKNNTPSPCHSTVAGSIIDPENQTLGENLNVVGTPFSLNYQSAQFPGRVAGRTLDIPLSGLTVPASLQGIDLQVLVAGQSFEEHFGSQANQHATFTWDGKDGFGRVVQGTQPVTVRVGYVYAGSYDAVGAFGSGGGATPIAGSHARLPMTLWQTYQTSLTQWDERGPGLGGWTLDVQNTYDPVGRVLYLGDGSQQRADALGPAITTVAGGGSALGDGGAATQARLANPAAVAVGPDGSVYVADTGDNRVRKVAPDGTITTVVGTGTAGFGGDGGPATQAELNAPGGIAVGADGSLYVADTANNRVRRVAPGGTITTVAGTGVAGFGGDGMPATQAELSGPLGLALGPDGSLYVADTGNNRVRRVGTDGLITTVAGNGTAGLAGDGSQATQAELNAPAGVAVGPDGSLYVADTGNNRIRQVGLAGVINTAVGGGTNPDGNVRIPGLLGLPVQLTAPTAVAVGPDGSLYIADTGGNRLHVVSPEGADQFNTSTIVGNGKAGASGDGGLGTAALIASPAGVAVGPDGSVTFADRGNNRVRRLSPTLPGVSAGNFLVPSSDGSQVFVFNHDGKQLRTLDALTGALRYQFTYDSTGRLTAVTDGDGNVTTIQRDAAGNPTAIVAPFGQTTTLALDGNGYLAGVTDPAGKTVQLAYGTGGLLSTLTDPLGTVHYFAFDALGRLAEDDVLAGGAVAHGQFLRRTDVSDSEYKVSLGPTAGPQLGYDVTTTPMGMSETINSSALGQFGGSRMSMHGTVEAFNPDGSTVTEQLGPDPRFGMAAPVIRTLTVNNGGTGTGQVSATTVTRTVTLTDPSNPLSLASQTDTVTVNGAAYTTTFNAATMQITSTSPAGRTETETLDSMGRVISTQVPGVTPVRFSYDSHGRVAAAAQGTRTETYAYDAQGNLAGVTDPLSHTMSFTYDADGRTTTQTFPDGSRVQYAYDAAGDLTSLTPPGRPATTFAYTPDRQLQSSTAPGVGSGPTTTQYAYDLGGRLSQATLPDGTAVTLTYNGLAPGSGGSGEGLLSNITLPQGAEPLSYVPGVFFGETQTGQLGGITTPDGGQVKFAYNAGLLTGTTWSGTVAGSVQQQYTSDGNFRLAAETVNNLAPVAYAYDQDGLLTRVGDLALTYDAHNGQLNGTTLGTIADSTSYDAFGEATGYQASAGGTTLISVQDTLDALGRIGQHTETVGGVTHTYGYAYDAVGRLTQVTQDGTAVAQYTYDANGNRLGATGPGGTVNGTYNNQDELLAYGTDTYAYTANGDLASKTDTTAHQTTSYTYDALGHLTAAVLPDGTHVGYVADGQGNRIGKKVNGTLVRGFLYDGDRLTAELDAAGSVVSRFVYASNRVTPDYLVKGGVEYRILTDERGSVRLVVNAATGQVVQQLSYDALGNVTQDSGPGFQPFGFAGGLYDRDTGLVHFGAREYDPQTGRWTAKDPALFRGGQANLYVYAGNDPVNSIDPHGLFSVTLSLYDVIGGGITFSYVKGQGLSAGFELGFGKGAGLEFNPTAKPFQGDPLWDSQGTLFAEVQASIGLAKGKVTVESVEDPCHPGDFAQFSTPHFTPQSSIGPLTLGPEGVTFNLNPEENPLENIEGLVKQFGDPELGLEGKAGFRVVFPIFGP